jgi:putative hydrolase of the HAD superfamily
MAKAGLRAVIFDLFGTLVDNWPLPVLDRMHARVAEAVGARPEAFARLYRDAFAERVKGVFPTAESYILRACRALGLSPTPEQVSAAAAVRMEVAREMIRPRSDAEATVTALKARDLRLGMISDCVWEAPVVWAEMALARLFDEAVFSVLVGMKKPEAGIYLLACERLGVRASECLYVGDGGSRELSGAAAVGMRPVLIRAPHESAGSVHRVDGEEWEGVKVEALSEVVGLV